MKVLFLALLGLIASTNAKVGFGPGEQEWGYVTVRPQAHMFWWLYYTTANVASPTQRPLVIWLQGGPGASGTGYGNFEELGPLDVDLKERNYTWVKEMNVLFIDNPVGTGFSYVDSQSAYTKDNAQIAADLVELMRGFYKELPQFETVPLYVVAESYGGKMASEFAYVLDKEIKAGNIKSNLKGVAMGDSWISPIDSVWSWAPYLLNNGIVDIRGHDEIMKYAQRTQDHLDAGRYAEATAAWGNTESIVLYYSSNVDFYNILTKVQSGSRLNVMKKQRSDGRMRGVLDQQTRARDLDDVMDQVHKALGLPKTVSWGAQSGWTFDFLEVDFMKPVTNVVELLLNQTSLQVVVFTGQLDLIVATPGTMKWVELLNWPGKSNWDRASRDPITVNRMVEGYVKKSGNFGVYWVDRSGHMVPADNPAGMGYILRALTTFG